MTELTLTAIVPKPNRAKVNEFNSLTERYLTRAAHFLPCTGALFDSEESLLSFTARSSTRPAATLLLFDSRGDTLTSEQFADLLGSLRDNATPRVLLAIGPADGWSSAALTRAHRVLSLGRMTLPHELARVVVAEQVYRALTILAGHPYHTGH